MPRSSDLPPWLRGRGASGAGRVGRAASVAALVLVVFGAGAVAGFSFAGRTRVAVAPAPAACPPAPTPVCPAERTAAIRQATAPARSAPSRRAKPTAASFEPLPERKPLEEGERTQALRAFAEKKGPELRDCLDDADHGPPLKVGAALEIGANGLVDFVQLIGAEGQSKDVRRCYASRLKHWRFPEDLLRGEEKLLVNFVL